MKIREILQAIEQLAPLPLQESFDNSGLQIGETHQEAKGVLLTLDVTEQVVDEAISLGCNLIVSHHPLAFRAFKSLTGKNYVERCMLKACKHDIVIYAAHTNLDNAMGGVNFKLAQMLGLQQVRILAPAEQSLVKLVTFVPHSHAENIRTALFNAGAGNIGNYDSCSYNLSGTGTFRANDDSTPYCGKIGELHHEEETRIEVILPAFRQNEVVRALITVHPYEEPAYDLYPLNNKWAQAGSGVVGSLPEAMEEETFLYLLKDTFKLTTLQHSAYTGKMIKDVAICGGSGAFLIPKAISYGADVFLTGEAKYNDFYDVEDKIMLTTIGHYESEVCTKEIFRKLLSDRFPDLELIPSSFDVNPVNYL
ncbi:dinuclear metal center YbgI/SA1388 family protein [Dysgonomonas sp. PH5-45]|uniref:Nif3-like dinuclear metal center hexameric protein n=1 Tax=unclassified Dysgonomonas TaxID=2630389 RepID=UPI0024745238|nr:MULTISPECIES: Nif3-like dinuclear metal center hexameric protein [unclassified Dysgonomonas]MDH6354572.1 dinuclear metal center YbgI/SA1388 family protein [Dysgonomonas sp. PH5-45]MDH6387372.1 dinuclear metal center YbgI/SA1388 family protein [Dysgonomonas sp. PH5-37]